MKRSSLRIAFFASAVILLAAFGSPAAQSADSWPTRPIRFVVPFAAGGGIDAVARELANGLATRLGQPVIVDNRPGARGVIGVESVAKAIPDGYTVLVTSDSFTIMPFVERNLAFDPRKSFAPVSLLTTQPLALAVHPSVTAQSLGEFIALAKARPGALSFGTGDLSQQLAAEVIKRAAGIEMTHIPYKGGAQALTDLLGGQLEAVVLGQAPLLGFARSGKVRVLAVTSARRSAALPNVPTAAESGLRGVDLSQWVFMMVPAQTPREVIARLNAEAANLLRAPGVIERLGAGGFETSPSTPQQLDAMILEAMARWGKLIPELNLKVE